MKFFIKMVLNYEASKQDDMVWCTLATEHIKWKLSGDLVQIGKLCENNKKIKYGKKLKNYFKPEVWCRN